MQNDDWKNIELSEEEMVGLKWTQFSLAVSGMPFTMEELEEDAKKRKAAGADPATVVKAIMERAKNEGCSYREALERYSQEQRARNASDDTNQ